MPHVLLACGIGGVGKTALAGLVAREMGTQVKVISGQTSVDKMRKLLTSMNDGDVIFYDEIHQAASGGRARAEWLLHYLQDGILLGPLGPMEVPAVTIVGATTEVGRLPPTIVSRFLVPPLSGYQLAEATLIAEGMAPGIFTSCGLPLPSWGVLVSVAEAGNRNPRAIRHILNTVRDIALVDGHEMGDAYDLGAALDLLEITEDGLNLTMCRYLMVLHDSVRRRCRRVDARIDHARARWPCGCGAGPAAEGSDHAHSTGAAADRLRCPSCTDHHALITLAARWHDRVTRCGLLSAQNGGCYRNRSPCNGSIRSPRCNPAQGCSERGSEAAKNGTSS
jgi:Holliday junction DNA helicase RuvB